ncbi:hypothetical protein [Accumulibacter sp.]|uniref:hypothetical protein n=1 Tax=Accumulibacter sp. TaxID=2053492 RepID=UPI0025EA94E3|nr:hypothetical protein [Accumulibacter sp.]MCM8594460.1 hypothetical protein [Accumulibacter sp.]MCM8626725.1 hypothetical protein [Accumulibacter sp.]MDS4048606.1 hypothetical protein [Accumulibacter sp.]
MSLPAPCREVARPAVSAVRRWLLALLVAFPLAGFAEQEIEVIALRHRTLDQVLPALQPLLEPGGALSGMNDQLIVRASRRNREQIRQALAAIDTPPRRLLILVSQNRDVRAAEQGAELSGRVVIEQEGRVAQPPGGMAGGNRIEIRRGASVVTAQGGDWQGRQAIGGTQRVQVIEGGRASIQIGQSLPVALRQVAYGPQGAVVSEGIVYRDLGQGFYAAPRVSGDRVTLEISPQFDTPGDQGYGSASTQRLVTTITGRLGQWIELGGSSQSSQFGSSGNLSSLRAQSSDSRSVWLRVDELP